MKIGYTQFEGQDHRELKQIRRIASGVDHFGKRTCLQYPQKIKSAIRKKTAIGHDCEQKEQGKASAG